MEEGLTHGKHRSLEVYYVRRLKPPLNRLRNSETTCTRNKSTNPQHQCFTTEVNIQFASR